jgi:hypothetical protein
MLCGVGILLWDDIIMMAWRISLCICNKTAKTLCATANKGMGTAANTNGTKDC